MKNKVFHLKGRIDFSTSPVMKDVISSAIEMGATNLIFNCTDLEYISVAGMKIFLGAALITAKKNGHVACCAMPDYIKELFLLAHFEDFLFIFPTLDEALRLLFRMDQSEPFSQSDLLIMTQLQGQASSPASLIT